MIDKDIKKLLKELKPQGFTVEQRKAALTLVAPNGARTNLPTGNNNRLGVVFVRKFAKQNGARI